tara:strand:+ start:181 stop:297 length:117 start_codon:yes stop_codon:yes gene_type:complete
MRGKKKTMRKKANGKKTMKKKGMPAALAKALAKKKKKR